MSDRYEKEIARYKTRLIEDVVNGRIYDRNGRCLSLVDLESCKYEINTIAYSNFPGELVVTTINCAKHGHGGVL
jgi:hypothetical protein